MPRRAQFARILQVVRDVIRQLGSSPTPLEQLQQALGQLRECLHPISQSSIVLPIDSDTRLRMGQCQGMAEETRMSAAILLVEDDPAARLALSKTLESVGYHVATASDGATAIAMIDQHSYDVVISDMRLPDIDGIEVLESAVRRPYPPSVILLTGYGTLDTAIAALRAGATDYLLKPCAPQTLISGVTNALKRRADTLRQADTLRNLAEGVAHLQRQLHTIGIDDMANVPRMSGAVASPEVDQISFGELRIGRFPHDVRYGREQLRLTPIEHALLRCLAEAGGDVVQYREIVRRTHGYDSSDSDAQTLLKSHVRNLRVKIGADIIASVRNTGYRLVEPDRADE